MYSRKQNMRKKQTHFNKRREKKAKFVKEKARKEVHLFRKVGAISYIVLDILSGENLCVVALCVIACCVWFEVQRHGRRTEEKLDKKATHPSNNECSLHAQDIVNSNSLIAVQ